MSRSKKIFFFGLGVFIVALIYLSYDISQRTSFPGSKSQLKERLKQKYLTDSVKEDTLMKMKKN
ncbi:MAG TPA: hypothetical protein VFD46_04160 [Chryseolinea sp.]|nr:hypothetical protein [Chryseolinea sp.]